jgi:3-oxoadipate enol-lactonase
VHRLAVDRHARHKLRVKRRVALAKSGACAIIWAVGRIKTAKGAIGVEELGRVELAEDSDEVVPTPIVFLHGVGSDKSVWRPQLDHFAASRHAVAFDYPGYGDSDPADSEADHDDFAVSILSAMDALEVERAHICGLSLGGVVAIALYHAAPDRCASLILADSFAAHPDGRGIFNRSVKASRLMTMRELAEERVDLLLAPNTNDALREAVVDTMAEISPDAYRVGARAVWLADQRERLDAIHVPALIIVGDQDHITPPMLSRDLVSRITGSSLVEIAGAGHLTNIEQPAAFNAAVDQFITGIA